MLVRFVPDDNAVSIELGYLLNLTILMLFTGGITGAFYLRADDSSQHAVRTGFTDLGSEIARDITNMNLTAVHSSSESTIRYSVIREIPLTIGGMGYRIELEDANSDGQACVNIRGKSYTVSTIINAVDTNVHAGGVVYSGSGQIQIMMTKNDSGTWIWVD